MPIRSPDSTRLLAARLTARLIAEGGAAACAGVPGTVLASVPAQHRRNVDNAQGLQTMHEALHSMHEAHQQAMRLQLVLAAH